MKLYTGRLTRKNHRTLSNDFIVMFRSVCVLIVTIVIYLSFLTTYYAQASLPKTTSIKFQRYGLEDGLLLNTVYRIAQDDKGFLWFGTTDAGLARFDGYEFKYFKSNPDNPHSLSNNWVTVIYTDQAKRMWLGTKRGLNVYHPEMNRFSRYYFPTEKFDSKMVKYITAIVQDKQGIFWIGTNNYGLIRFDVDKNDYKYYIHESHDVNSLSDNSVTALYEDSQERIWVATKKGGLNLFHRDENRFEHFLYADDDKNTISTNFVLSINEDQHGNIWIGTGLGANRINMQTGNIIHYAKSEKIHSISGNVVNHIMRDSQHQLWLGTNEGINIYDEKNDRFISYQSNPFRSDSLSDNDVTMSFEDNHGNIWIGTRRGGLNRYNQSRQLFQNITSNPMDGNSLLGKNVFGISMDRNNDLWIGTLDGGLSRYDSKNRQFKHYKPDLDKPYYFASRRVGPIITDSVGDVWIGTYGKGLARYDRESKEFSYYTHDENNDTSLGHDLVITVLEDKQNNIWVGTKDAGLNLLDRNTGIFKRYQHDVNNPDSIASNEIWSLLEDSAGNLWVGTADNGLDLFDRQSGKFIHYQHSTNNSYSVSNNAISDIVEDSTGSLWITTSLGLNYFDYKSGKFRRYYEKDGMASDMAYGILESKPGSLWISGGNGISHFDVSKQTFTNYDMGDGLQANEYNGGASYKLASGELAFGSIDGVSLFHPDKMQGNTQVPKVVITNFLLFNKDVAIADNNDTIANDGTGTKKSIEDKENQFFLERSIETTKSLILSYKESFFSFDFSALHFTNVKNNRYAYQLKGWDKDWIVTDYKMRRASYTNIPAGNYIFQVRASNSDGAWNNEGSSIAIKILPPPWKTWWAYLIYLGVVFLILFIIWQWFSNKQRAEREHMAREKEHMDLEKEREVSNRLKDIDKMKDEFLANTSHELRTPLNGIVGLSEILLDYDSGTIPEGELNEYLRMICFSGKRLSHLINDILDFSKLKNNTIELQLKSVDLHSLINVILTLLKPLVANKDVELLNHVDKSISCVYADENRLQQIFYNLIGNSVKFTKKGSVIIDATEREGEINIRIKDTGIGIAEDKVGNIFDYFEQAEGSIAREYAGTGLGLAVTKQLVNLHGSDIHVASQLEKGSTFSFTLTASTADPENQPMDKRITIQDKNQKKNSNPEETVKILQQQFEDKDNSSYRLMNNDVSAPDIKILDNTFNILIIDDEDINRKVLRGFLQQYNFIITEVDNGYDALRLFQADSYIDLVLLDIMMPNLSGYEVCKKLREQYSRETLPILFLSAKNDNEESSEAFKLGCNDYLVKPIAKNELLVRLQAQLELLILHREQMKNTASK